MSKGRREAIPRGVDPAVGYHIRVRCDDGDSSARPQERVVFDGPRRLRGEDLGAGKEANPYRGRCRSPVRLLQGNDNTLEEETLNKSALASALS